MTNQAHKKRKIKSLSKETPKPESNSCLEKAFKCKTCDKCFTLRENLQIRARSHTGEKPYHCNTCDKCFKKKRNLERHERSHNGEKPYQCKTCDKYFTEKGN